MLFSAEKYAATPEREVKTETGEVINVPAINPVDRSRMANDPLFLNLIIMCLRAQAMMHNQFGEMPQIHPPYLRSTGEAVMHNSRFASAYRNSKQAALNLADWLPGGAYYVPEIGIQKPSDKGDCGDGNG